MIGMSNSGSFETAKAIPATTTDNNNSTIILGIIDNGLIVLTTFLNNFFECNIISLFLIRITL